MEDGYVNVYVPTTKHFRVNRINFRGSKYTGDCSGLAYWYYMNINVHCNDLIIYIYGDFHTTIPNPQHITVEFESGGIRTQKYHMSVDINGMFYAQNLMGAKKKKRTKKKRVKKNKNSK